VETVSWRILLGSLLNFVSTCGAMTRYHQAESTPKG
jgi:hypothetical protein